jgi:hypothetical protein
MKPMIKRNLIRRLEELEARTEVEAKVLILRFVGVDPDGTKEYGPPWEVRIPPAARRPQRARWR